MDYVVYGTGYGATLMLLGYALRTWGPNWRFRDEDERAYARGELRSARAAWTRFTSGLGAVVATCGVILILFTFALMLANPGDETSEMVSLVLSGLLLVAVAVWAWMYVDRFGTFGVVKAPAALAGSTEPLRYDNRPQQQDTAAPAADETDEDTDEADEILEPDVEEDEEDTDLELDEEDSAELEARYSKFETHHPDGEARDVETDAAPDSDEAPAVEGETETVEPGSEDAEARASKFEQHHPDAEGYTDSLDDASVEDSVTTAEPAPEAEADVIPEQVDEVVVETIDEPVLEPDDVPAEETAAPEETPEPAGTDESSSGQESGADEGGREDALRRLRERQANRARKADDA